MITYYTFYIKKTFLFLLLTIITISGYGQQESKYSQYMFNGLLVNPAYAGVKGCWNLNAFARNQWAGFDGAPKVQAFSGDVPLGKSAIGAYILNDQLGAQSSLSAFASYAYKLNLAEDLRLSFGIAGGFTQYSLDGNKLSSFDPKNDPLSPPNRQSKVLPDANAGLYLTDDKFYVGLSVSRLIAGFYNIDYDRFVIIPTQSQNLYITGGYVADLNQDFKLYPSILIKNDFKNPMQFDGNLAILFRETFWLGASYRSSLNINKDWEARGSENVLSFISQFIISKKYRIGYSYDIYGGSLNKAFGSTHEISLGATLDFRGNGVRCYF